MPTLDPASRPAAALGITPLAALPPHALYPPFPHQSFAPLRRPASAPPSRPRSPTPASDQSAYPYPSPYPHPHLLVRPGSPAHGVPMDRDASPHRGLHPRKAHTPHRSIPRSATRSPSLSARRGIEGTSPGATSMAVPGLSVSGASSGGGGGVGGAGMGLYSSSMPRSGLHKDATASVVFDDDDDPIADTDADADVDESNQRVPPAEAPVVGSPGTLGGVHRDDLGMAMGMGMGMPGATVGLKPELPALPNAVSIAQHAQSSTITTTQQAPNTSPDPNADADADQQPASAPWNPASDAPAPTPDDVIQLDVFRLFRSNPRALLAPAGAGRAGPATPRRTHTAPGPGSGQGVGAGQQQSDAMAAGGFAWGQHQNQNQHVPPALPHRRSHHGPSGPSGSSAPTSGFGLPPSSAPIAASAEPYADPPRGRQRGRQVARGGRQGPPGSGATSVSAAGTGGGGADSGAQAVPGGRALRARQSAGPDANPDADDAMGLDGDDGSDVSSISDLSDDLSDMSGTWSGTGSARSRSESPAGFSSDGGYGYGSGMDVDGDGDGAPGAAAKRRGERAKAARRKREMVEGVERFDPEGRYTVPPGAPAVVWRGIPRPPPASSLSHLLSPEEMETCGVLRIRVEQYLHAKRTMVRQGRRGWFKKTAAKRWFRMDVNKTGKLYDWFVQLGWIPPPPPVNTPAYAAAAPAGNAAPAGW